MLSGILLICVVLGILGYLLRETISDNTKAAIRKYAEVSPEEIEDPLIGAVGHVVEKRGASELMKVRIRGERWNANLVGGRELPAGTEVRVTAVHGLTLDVEERVGEQPGTADETVEETRG